MTAGSAQPVTSLYVHVPFCAHKCEYCAFYSEAAAGELVNRYVAALMREMALVADDLKPHTLFFGGGTPSLLNLRQWEQILKAMERFDLLGALEWTVECNPATVSPDKARLLRALWGPGYLALSWCEPSTMCSRSRSWQREGSSISRVVFHIVRGGTFQGSTSTAGS